MQSLEHRREVEPSNRRRQRMSRLPLYVLMLSLSAAVLAERAPLIQSPDVRIQAPPGMVTIAGTPRLAYELRIANFQRVDIVLDGIEIIDAAKDQSLFRYRGDALATRILRQTPKTDTLTLAPGEHAIAYFWLPLKDDEIPLELRHRIEYRVSGRNGSVAGTLDGVSVSVPRSVPLVLNPPLRGGPWVALYDPTMAHGHRTSIYTIDGRARIPARFAIDWMRLGEDGSKARADESKIDNWHGYGADVLAVADAVVADARDDMPEPATLESARRAMALEAASGNYVVLDLGAGRYAFYEHLKHGSVRVQPGDRVESGEVIGQLGNSGSSSSGPHLHLHVADANSMLGAEGLPYVFRTFDVVGGFESIAAFRRGEPWHSTSASGQRQYELPDANVVLEFAETSE